MTSELNFILVDRRYSGVVFNLGAGAFFLQKRDKAAGITNPDLISLFGGSASLDEDPRECLQREILEELGFEIDWTLTYHLADVIKSNGKESVILMSIYVSRQLSFDDIEETVVSEGKGVVFPHQIESGDSLSPFCRFVFERLLQ